MVREKGLEPSRPKALAPKASVSTNSTTRAYRAIIADDSGLEKIDTNDGACGMI